MKNYFLKPATNPDSVRPVNVTEEQEFPHILDGQENEPVNFAGIPLRMLKPYRSPKEVVYEFEIITKSLETRRLRLVCDEAGFFNAEEAAAIREFLTSDSSVVAFTDTTFVVDKVTGEKEEILKGGTPYIRVGAREWTTVCKYTGERDEPWKVERNRR
ncbi:hypothetical protein [Rufibacter quisquiliarum]|uniref:Uncharacterized protein n=1 Tax=Rufibacter quisquiliarum TaxID=1549639 RepID=A0A839GEY1_9BACT|nr:hypothetical protein [Rufibacter quisquiliarum]MBA9076103.1 hypothetical protein [Rufibacter quisquiliarum]